MGISLEKSPIAADISIFRTLSSVRQLPVVVWIGVLRLMGLWT